MRMIEHLYDDVYNLFPIYLDVWEHGHAGARRPRVYVICAHKQKARQIQDVYALYAKISGAICKHVRTSPSDYLVSEPLEIMRYAYQIARSRKLDLSPATCTCWNYFNSKNQVAKLYPLTSRFCIKHCHCVFCQWLHY